MTVALPRDGRPPESWRVAPPEKRGVDSHVPETLRAFGADPDVKLNGILVARHG